MSDKAERRIALQRCAGRLAAGAVVVAASVAALAPGASAAPRDTIYHGGLASSLSSQLTGSTNDSIAFVANTGQLYIAGTLPPVGAAGSIMVMPGTSPSTTGLSDGGYEVAYQATNGALAVYGSAGTSNLGLGMYPGTSPSIIELPAGGFEIAFENNLGDLWTVGPASSGDQGLGMMPGTSPSMTALASGFEIAFQANTGQLWTDGTEPGSGNAGFLNMAKGTSPSITELLGPDGGFEVAYQTTGTDLAIYGADGTSNTELGMAAGASPSITGLVGGGWEAAFTDNVEQLYTAGTAFGSGDAGQLGVTPGTDPSISDADLTGSGIDTGFLVAFNALGGNMWTYGANGNTGSLNLGMLAGTSPSLIGL